MLQTVAAIITILNFIYAVLVLPGMGPTLAPQAINISPTLAFFLFFVLEFLCSYFICLSVIQLVDRKPNYVRTYSLVFGVVNAGTTVFNYQFLFNIQKFETASDSVVFCAFVLAAFMIDWIVISDMRRVSKRYIWRSPMDFRIEDRDEFLTIQFFVYFLSALYFLVVAETL